jgi:putative nucleotidyltransferase with HDIG domain
MRKYVAGTLLGNHYPYMNAQRLQSPVPAPFMNGLAARVERARLERRLVPPAAGRITVLVGPAGCGKSELLQTFRDDPRAIYFRAGQAHRTFARFVHGLAQSVASVAPGAQVSFARAWERALQSRSPGNALAHWLCEHLQDAQYPLAIDDLRDAADPSIAAFIAKLAELRPHTRLTIALRSIGALPVARWMATGHMERPIDETDLRFNESEVAAAGRQFGLALEREEIGTILAATGGSTTAVMYALTQLCRNPRAFARTAMPAAFEEVAAAIFSRRSARQRALLFSAALYPSIDDELLALSGWDDALEIRNAMAADAPFMWEQDAAGCLRFHDRFRDHLSRQFAGYDLDFRSMIANRTVHALQLAGRNAEALDVATRQGLSGAMGELLDEHGFEILESGEVDVVSEALDAFESAEQSLGARVIALRGYLDSRRGRLDTAEAYFRLGLETAQDERTRVEIALYYTRELALRRREDACDVLAPFADSATLPRSVLIDVRSSFAQGLAAASRLDQARARTDEVLAMLDADLPRALRARVLARAAYVAIETGALSLARSRALTAAPLAVAESLFEVAASAYSVLYNIAYRAGDAASSLKYLRFVRDMGVKSGTLRLELYALLGMYELCAEAGDEAALAQLERQLAAVDKHDAGVEIMEALLPGKALQAAWSGDFAAAIDLLRPTAEHYATPERRALSWAQIGLYCAAAGEAQRSREAIRSAQGTLERVDVRTTVSEVTRLTLALATLAGGDTAAASEWVNAADRTSCDAIPRIRALRTAVDALIAGPLESATIRARVAGALADLHAASFGGMTLLIEALPYRRAGELAGQTIGTVLAKHELPARFDAAAESGDAGALRAWLDALPGSVVRHLSIGAAFKRWAERRLLLDPRREAAIRDLRREIEAYVPSAPVFIRLVDTIDTSIDTLIELLDVTSPLTGEHSRAVSAWCSRIGRMLDLPEDEVEFVRRCGLVHDIGKIRTPAEILNAPRGLTTAEWPIMRNHAADGARIVANIGDLQPFIPTVRGHHERLNGKGYPDGLRSTAIPLAARIVSVADSFNAMIARRPYRLPLAPDEALDELERNRQTQFDPEIVDAMIRVVHGRLTEHPTV